MGKLPERENYQFGFHDEVESVFTTGKGVSEATVREISNRKKRTRLDAGLPFKSL